MRSTRALSIVIAPENRGLSRIMEDCSAFLNMPVPAGAGVPIQRPYLQMQSEWGPNPRLRPKSLRAIPPAAVRAGADFWIDRRVFRYRDQARHAARYAVPKPEPLDFLSISPVVHRRLPGRFLHPRWLPGRTTPRWYRRCFQSRRFRREAFRRRNLQTLDPVRRFARRPAADFNASPSSLTSAKISAGCPASTSRGFCGAQHTRAGP